MPNTNSETNYASVFLASLEEAQELFSANGESLDTPLNTFPFLGGLEYVWYVRPWTNNNGQPMKSYEAQMADDDYWFQTESKDMGAPLVLIPQMTNQLREDGKKVGVCTGYFYAGINLCYPNAKGQFTGINEGFAGWKTTIREDGKSKLWACSSLDKSDVQEDIRRRAGQLFLSKAKVQKTRQTGVITTPDGEQRIVGFHLVKIPQFNLAIRVNSDAATVLYYPNGFDGVFSVVNLLQVPEHLEGVVRGNGSMVLNLNTSVACASGIKPVRSFFQGDQITEEGLAWFLQNFAEPISRNLRALTPPVVIRASLMCPDHVKGDYSNSPVTAPKKAQNQVLPELRIPEATVEVSTALFEA